MNYRILSDVFSDGRPLQKPVIPVAAYVGATLGSAALNGVSNLITNKANKDAALEVQKQNQDWSESMYNKYYSPQAQVEQLRAAGLNPGISQSASFSGGSMPSSPPVSVPKYDSPQIPDLGNSLAQMQQMKLTEEQANVAKQESLAKIINGGSELAKTFGYSAGRQFIESGISSLNLDGQNNYQKLFDIQYTRQCLETDLRDRFGERDYKAKLDAIYQGVNESAVRIGKMISDASVNDAKIKELASEVAKNFAQAGLFNQQASQIATLLPYMEENLMYVVGMQAMNFLREEGNFSQESNYRDWQHGDKAKSAYKGTMSMDDRNNVVGKFMTEFVSKIPTGAWQSGFDYKRTSSQYGSQYEYVFGKGWQMRE